LWPCFMPLPSLGSSLQSFSLTKIAHLSRGRWLPCSYPPACGGVSCFVVRSLVSPTSTLSRSCLDPPRAMDFLSPCPKAWFPVVLDSARQGRLVRPASPASKLCSPRETVPPTLGCPAAVGRFSLGVRPLRSFLLPRLGPSTRPVARTEPAAGQRDSKDR